MREADQADGSALVAVAPLADLAKGLQRSARAALMDSLARSKTLPLAGTT